MNSRWSSKFYLIVLLWACSCKEQIVHDLSEVKANRVLTQLHTQDIQASKEKQGDGRWAIAVNGSEVLEALRHLDHSRTFHKVPKSPDLQMGLLSGRESQKFSYERAVSREIEATLVSLDGVLEARVHINFPSTDLILARKKSRHQEGSGSVLLITGEHFHSEANEVRSLVSGATGIAVDKIAVLVSPNRQATGYDIVPTAIPSADQAPLESSAQIVAGLRGFGVVLEEAAKLTESSSAVVVGLCALGALLLGMLMIGRRTGI